MTQRRLPIAIRFALQIAVTSLVAAPVIAGDKPDEASQTASAAVTGSRIQRADQDHGRAVQIIDRAEIEASGDISVAELLRDSTLAAFGNYRPLSGSSVQSLSDIDLRGLGSKRTLVLIDGRRAASSPFEGAIVNLNLIPIGAVERIEILPEGASAIYGSDAIGGVVNIIMRKDLQGAELSYMRGNPSVRGGDIESGSASFGASGDRGRMLATVSYNQRDIVFTRDQIGGDVLGLSTFANNYRLANASGTAPTGAFAPMPGFDCSGSGLGVGGAADLYFETTVGGGNICSFNFNGIAADDASTDTSALHTSAEYLINDNWSAFLQAAVTRNESFGRTAPAFAEFFVPEGSPNDPVLGDGRGAFVRHRFASVGPQDTHTDEDAYDVRIGFKGRVADTIDLEFGARRYENQAYQLGRNFIVSRLAQQAIADGSYNLSDPFGADRATLDSISATINRDASWLGREVFASASFSPFELAGGASTLVLGAEWRSEDFADVYDSLQSAGEVIGVNGTSIAGDRSVRSAFFEWLFPISDRFDLTAAGRFDDYSDYGSDFSPKLGFRWQAMDRLSVHGSYGHGFSAPSLTQYPGPGVIAIADLQAEQSKHLSLGATYEANDWLQLGLDYYRVEIDDRIVALDLSSIQLPPDLPLIRDPITGEILFTISPLANAGTLDTDGLDLTVRTRFDFGAYGELVSELRASHVLDYQISEHQGGVDLILEPLGYLGYPDLRAKLTHDWSLGDFSLHWQTHFIAGTDRFAAAALPAVGGYTTHDLQLSWKAPWNARIAIGATNIGDKNPSLDSAAFGERWNYYLYDTYGRTPYIRYTQSF